MGAEILGTAEKFGTHRKQNHMKRQVCFALCGNSNLGENTAMTFQPEPKFTHGKPPANNATTAVLLCNLGTPDAPTTAALRTYLREFLSDPRVVEIPRLVWWFILNLIILPFRSGQSAKKYASIWTREGSPLKVHTAAQAQALRAALGERGHDQLTVAMAMRYGSPSLPEVLAQLIRLRQLVLQ